MSTLQLTELQTRTAGMLTAMFTENTGASIGDSGSAYGRNWERNQGLTLTDFLAQPKATWIRNEWVTLNAWHYLNDRLEYSKTAEILTRLMHVWELQDYDNRNPWDLGDQELYLEHLGATFGGCWNSYNWDNMLSQNVQGYDFELMGMQFVLLQVHGGCDARGGYTRPVIFEVSDEYWLADCDRASLYCDRCNVSGDADDTSEWYRHGELPAPLFGEPERYLIAPDGYDQANGCPECGGDLIAEPMEVY